MSEVTNKPTLDELLEWARSYTPTEEEKRRSVISFAWGNVNLHNPDITREMIEKEYDKLHPQEGGLNGV